MKRRRTRKTNGRGAPKWMVTYSDMITLILVFFVLLFSMSQIDETKFDAVSDSFRNRMIFDFYPSPIQMENPTEKASQEENGKTSNEFANPSSHENGMYDGKESHKRQDSLDTLTADVKSYLDKHDLNDVISANRTERGVVLVMQESILFQSGEASLQKSGKPFLHKIGSMLQEIPNDVKVEGHTDSRPISNYRYPSNWELSSARASSVIRYLINENHFDKNRFLSVGYGDTKPVAPNDSEKNWKKNRRVEMIILEKDQVDDD